MQKLFVFILFMMAFHSIEGAELVVNNLTRNIQASNLLYDSVNVYPGDKTIFQFEHSKHTNAETYLWYIEGQDVIKTEKPSLEWIVTEIPGKRNVIVLSMDKNSRIDGSAFKLFVGNFESPTISIEEGAKRPGCPLLLRAIVNPYTHALVPAGNLCEYNWMVEKEGKVLGTYITNTNELELLLPLDPGLIELKVSANDTQSHSPETRYSIFVKPW